MVRITVHSHTYTFACSIRDGTECELLARDLVPGDVIVLRMGDRVPADLRLVDAVDLEVDESSFTGETHPSRKHVMAIEVATNGQDALTSTPTENNGRGKHVSQLRNIGVKFVVLTRIIQMHSFHGHACALRSRSWRGHQYRTKFGVWRCLQDDAS
jgi:P-type E1-E2 ATPase